MTYRSTDGQLCRVREGARRLWRADDGAERNHPCGVRRTIAKTREGIPALLEFITEQAEDFSITLY